jgi:hypothetical protein
MKKLSKKEITFVLSRLSGNTMEAAFAEGYPSSRKWELASREREANEVMKRPHVKAFYETEREKIDKEAAEEARKKAIWNREKSLKVLSFIVQTGLDDISEARANKKIDPNAPPATNPAIANSIIKAIAELNKMTDGEYDEDEKSLARQLTDLNPDLIDEDPLDYAVSVKRKVSDEN